MTRKGIALCFLATCLARPAFAQSQSSGPGPDDRTSPAVIRQRYAEHYRHERLERLGRKHGALEHRRLARERAKVEKLIERAESGERITSADVDRALGLLP